MAIARCVTVLLMLLAGSVEAQGANDADFQVIYLVRHAEKQLADPANKDPDLTEQGQQRAAQLARILRDSGIKSIYSTDYRRTRQTAAPLAEKLQLPVTNYDPADLSALADRLRESSDNTLVVGHSNTTPQLVELLGGDSVSAIDEAREYDRLYILVLRGGKVTSLLQRYGACADC